MADDPSMCKVAEVAAVLRVSPSTIYRAIRRGDIPHTRVCRTVRVPRSYLTDALAVTP